MVLVCGLLVFVLTTGFAGLVTASDVPAGENAAGIDGTADEPVTGGEPDPHVADVSTLGLALAFGVIAGAALRRLLD